MLLSLSTFNFYFKAFYPMKDNVTIRKGDIVVRIFRQESRLHFKLLTFFATRLFSMILTEFTLKTVNWFQAAINSSDVNLVTDEFLACAFPSNISV